jgi:hypothetical protein
MKTPTTAAGAAAGNSATGSAEATPVGKMPLEALQLAAARPDATQV